MNNKCYSVNSPRQVDTSLKSDRFCYFIYFIFVIIEISFKLKTSLTKENDKEFKMICNKFLFKNHRVGHSLSLATHIRAGFFFFFNRRKKN